MKPLLQFAGLSAIICLQGCGGCMIKHDGAETAQAAPAKAKIPVPVSTSNKIISDEKDLTGYWVGAFRKHADYDTLDYYEQYADANKINLSIDAIEGNKVTGHSIVAGNFRPFTGTITLNRNTYEFLVNEPGDDKYDGLFMFSIGNGDSVLTGTWQAKHKVKTPVRYYDLTKHFFKYDPDINLASERFTDTAKKKRYKGNDDEDADFAYSMSTINFSEYNASNKLLTTSQLSNLKAADLLVIRNSIFARHGYSFKKPALRGFFDMQPWYIPVSTDVTNTLTSIEKQNIALLLRYEKNAKEYYDTFGR